MNKEDIENLVNTDFNKMEIIINRIYKEDYVRKLEEENTQLKEQRQELRSWLENEKDRLARECSQIYEDSLGKTRLVSEDIFNEVNKILSKLNELEGENE